MRIVYITVLVCRYTCVHIDHRGVENRAYDFLLRYIVQSIPHIRIYCVGTSISVSMV